MRRDLHVRQHLRRREIEFFAQVVAGNHRFHSRHGLGLARVDGNNLRVRVGAPLKRQVEHAGQIDIVDVTAFAGDQRRIFDPFGRCADESVWFVFGCHELTSNRVVVRDSLVWRSRLSNTPRPETRTLSRGSLHRRSRSPYAHRRLRRAACTPRRHRNLLPDRFLQPPWRPPRRSSAG